MANFPENFSTPDMQQIMRLAQSDTAKKLFSLMQSADNQKLQAAMDQASAGNLQGAKAALGSLLDDPQVKKMMQKLKDDANG